MAELLWRGKHEPAPTPTAGELTTVAEYPARPRGGGWVNRLIHGDRAQVLPALRREFKGKVRLIYVDPPFDTGTTFRSRATVRDGEGERQQARQLAYDDRWGGDLDTYLRWLHETFVLLRDLLHPHGSLFVHLDWRAVHYARVILDEVLSPGAFRAEIIWRYRRWPTRTANLQRMHDTLLYYARDPARPPIFHTLYEPLAPSTLKAFGTRRQQADFSSGRRRPGLTEVESPGAPLSDVWDIGIVAPSGHERVGYPTQKPTALLERIVQMASGQGDLVLDCFCGSGTTAVAAERLGRRWIACDVGQPALHTTLRRVLTLEQPRPLVVQRVGGDEAARGKLTARAERDGREVKVTLRGYTSPGGEAGLSWLGAWAVDWDHDGETFRAREWFCREHRHAPLEATARHRYRRDGDFPIAVRAFDLLGNEARWQSRGRLGKGAPSQWFRSSPACSPSAWAPSCWRRPASGAGCWGRSTASWW